MSERLRVGFIGLGDMGGPMARHIIEAGFPTTLWARRAESLLQFEDLDYRTGTSPADLASTCDVVGVCVFDDDDLRQVPLGEHGVFGGLAPGGIVLVHSTVSISTVAELEATARECGLALLDAPVSGSRQISVEGQLAVMVGGDRAAYERVLPVLRTFSRAQSHLGPVGSGEFMKLLNNSVYAANLTMADEALDQAKRFGMNVDEAVKVLEASSGASFALTMLVSKVQTDPEAAAHMLRIRENNVVVYRRACAGAGLERRLLDSASAAAIDVVRRYV